VLAEWQTVFNWKIIILFENMHMLNTFFLFFSVKFFIWDWSTPSSKHGWQQHNCGAESLWWLPATNTKYYHAQQTSSNNAYSITTPNWCWENLPTQSAYDIQSIEPKCSTNLPMWSLP
jgi:hypothetical protein